MKADEVAAADPLRRLRHDLANPLSALLTEIQLLLLDEKTMPPEVAHGLHEIEGLARRMRDILAASRDRR